MFYFIHENTINWIASSEEELQMRLLASPEFKDKEFFEIEEDISNYKIAGNKIIKKTEEDLLQEKLVETRAKKLQELSDYDSGSEVNSFTINRVEMWLSKEERNSLYRLATACKNMGQKTMQLQLADGSFVEFPPDNVLAMLDALEVYAGLSFGNTGRKEIEIKSINTIEDIERYDITTGYPLKLNF
ncbi:MAG: hypothetical protein ACRC0A_05170 [Chitinophagaceae bacterium]